MDAEYTSLHTLLKDEIGLIEELIRLVESETEALRTLSADKLTQTAKEKETILLRQQMLEETRQSVVENLAARMGAPVSALTLERLAEEAPPPVARHLAEDRRRLKQLTTHAAAVQERYGMLLADSQRMVEVSQSVLHQLLNRNSSYGKGGQINAAGKSGKMLSTEV